MSKTPTTGSPVRSKAYWTDIYKRVSSMTKEECDKVLIENGIGYTEGYLLLESRHELSDLCKRNGADRLSW